MASPTGLHETMMRRALEQAGRAGAAGEVPIGAVLVRDGTVIGQGFNQPISAGDPTAHAEITALREGARTTGNYRLAGTTLYATVEPCLMCVGAIFNARVAALVYGADEPKFGAIRSTMTAASLRLNHRFDVVSGVLEDECRELLVAFFRSRRGVS